MKRPCRGLFAAILLVGLQPEGTHSYLARGIHSYQRHYPRRPLASTTGEHADADTANIQSKVEARSEVS